MPHPSAHALSILLDVMRQAWWSMVAGFAVLGATFYGGATVASAWRRAETAAQHDSAQPDPVETAARPEPAEIDVRSEVTRGIAEIESFLGGACPDAGRTRSMDVDADHHHSADASADHRPSEPDPSSTFGRRHRRS